MSEKVAESIKCEVNLIHFYYMTYFQQALIHTSNQRFKVVIRQGLFIKVILLFMAFIFKGQENTFLSEAFSKKAPSAQISQQPGKKMDTNANAASELKEDGSEESLNCWR